MISKNEIINLLKTSMNLEGFIANKEEQGVYWHKKYIDRTHNLYIGFNGSLDRYFLQSPFVSITFHNIEEKIISLANELNITFDEGDYTIKKKPFEKEEFNFEIFQMRLDNKENFDKVFEAEMEFIKIGAIPFFEKYQDLNNVAELLSKLKPQEVVPYIQGAKLFCKTILILKEVNHPKYKEKCNEYYEVLKIQALKKEVYAEQLKLFEVLFF